MAKLRTRDDAREKKKTPEQETNDRYASLKNSGRIVARIIDGRSGLRVIPAVYAIRMRDEGVRRLLMNDYTPTIGQIIGDVTILTAKGEEMVQNIRGFYKLQHNMFTLLIEEHLGGE